MNRRILAGLFALAALLGMGGVFAPQASAYGTGYHWVTCNTRTPPGATGWVELCPQFYGSIPAGQGYVAYRPTKICVTNQSNVTVTVDEIRWGYDPDGDGVRTWTNTNGTNVTLAPGQGTSISPTTWSSRFSYDDPMVAANIDRGTWTSTPGVEPMAANTSSAGC